MKMTKLVNPMLPSCEMYASYHAATEIDLYKNKDFAYKIVKVMLCFSSGYSNGYTCVAQVLFEIHRLGVARFQNVPDDESRRDKR